MLDTSTTTLEIARRMVKYRNVTAIPSSLVIVSALRFAARVRVVLLGGFLRGGSPNEPGDVRFLAAGEWDA